MTYVTLLGVDRGKSPTDGNTGSTKKGLALGELACAGRDQGLVGGSFGRHSSILAREMCDSLIKLYEKNGLIGRKTI